MPCTVKPAHAVSKFTSNGVLLGQWPPGLASTPGRVQQGRPTAGCVWPFRMALMAHCWAGQADQAWQGYTGQGAWSMAIGPVWEALIHATSCHLPPLPACSPSAAARLRSLLMSIFRAGWFLPSKTGKCVVEQEGVCVCVCVFLLMYFFVFLRHATVHSRPTRARFTHPCWSPVTSLHTVHSCTRAHTPICIRLLCSRPQEKWLIEGFGSNLKSKITNNSMARPFSMQHFHIDTVCTTVELWSDFIFLLS